MNQNGNTATELAIDSFVERKVQAQWEKHRKWAVLSSNRRRRIEVSRIVKLVVVSMGAALQVASTQVAENQRATISFIGGLLVGIGGYIKGNFLTDEMVQKMVECLAKSQAIRSEIYKFRAQAQPYEDFKSNPDEALNRLQEECGRISDSSYDENFYLTSPDSEPVPKQLHSANSYIKERMEKMKNDFFLKRAQNMRRRGEFCSACENALLTLGSIAGIGATQKFPDAIQEVLSAMSGWGGAFTTISAAFANHVAKEKFTDVARKYTTAAAKLEQLEESWPRDVRNPECAGWDEQVTKCEDVILSTINEWVKVETGREVSAIQQLQAAAASKKDA